jgi:cytosine/adenosine deaminase-related metal-dependent hydrolase
MTASILLRGGCVLTLGGHTRNLTTGDVLIENGVIAELGPGLRSRDAEVVDARSAIVMPGFVDAHRHTCASLFRNVEAPLPKVTDPADVYAATLLGLLGAAEAGITTVVDWAHLPDEVAAEAALRAHADSGLRTVFVHVRTPTDAATGRPLREALSRLREAVGPRTSIALGSVLTGVGEIAPVARDWEAARELGVRIHAHTGLETPARGSVAALAEMGALGQDVTIAHLTGLDETDLDAAAGRRAAVVLAPSSEMAGGSGPPPIQELMDREVRPGLGIGDERVAPGDMFAQMRATISLQHAVVFDRKLVGKAHLPRLMTTRDAIRYATVDGARAAGLAGLVGSLEPGMRADLVVLRTDRPNVFPVNDPIGAVVWGMDTSNLDLVYVDGRPVMRAGTLEADVPAARRLAEASLVRVLAAPGRALGDTVVSGR